MMHYREWLDGVRYTDDLDGGGRSLAPVFHSALEGRKFKRCFEWCAGPAWIGLWLLENGVCEELVTGDINPAAVEMVNLTIAATGANVIAILSDNMDKVDGKFDLVVGNPPNYCNIQSSHLFGHLRNDLRPSDVEWNIHRDFYANIREHLADGAELWVSEVEPFQAEVHILGQMYDKRPQLPIVEFMDMMAIGGLRLEKVLPFNLDTVQMALLKSRVI